MYEDQNKQEFLTKSASRTVQLCEDQDITKKWDLNIPQLVQNFIVAPPFTSSIIIFQYNHQQTSYLTIQALPPYECHRACF